MRVPRARRARDFEVPRDSRVVRWLLRVAGGAYLRMAFGIRATTVENMALVRSAVARFQRGRSRLIVAFRHVDVADGPVVLNALAGILARWDRRHPATDTDDRLLRPPHAVFLYGKDVLNWAGPGARIVFPRLGGIPVVNTRIDRAAHQAIRHALQAGAFPLALAPEAQVTYHMFRVSQIATGIGTMARWAADETDTPVSIVPLALGYRFHGETVPIVETVLGRIADELGEALPSDGDLRTRLLFTAGRVVDRLAAMYASAYPALASVARTDGARPLDERIAALCDAILRRCESGMTAPDDASLLHRLFAVRYAAIDLAFPPDGDPRRAAPFARSWSNLRTLDGAAMARHAQIVDVLMYINAAYIEHSPSEPRLVEFALNLLDVLNRVHGGSIHTRYFPRPRTAHLLAGTPIDVNRLAAAAGSGREASTAINDAVRAAFIDLAEKMEERVTRRSRPGDRELY